MDGIEKIDKSAKLDDHQSNNVLNVDKSDFEVFEALAMDLASNNNNSNATNANSTSNALSGSPPGSYSQTIPTFSHDSTTSGSGGGGGNQTPTSGGQQQTGLGSHNSSSGDIYSHKSSSGDIIFADERTLEKCKNDMDIQKQQQLEKSSQQPNNQYPDYKTIST